MEEEKEDDRGTFKVTSVCYLACCGHEPRARRNLLSPYHPPFPPGVSGAFAASAAEAEQPSSAGHLAECSCPPVSQAGSARAQL